MTAGDEVLAATTATIPTKATIREIELTRDRIRVARKVKSWENGTTGGNSVTHVIQFDRARIEFSAANWKILTELLAELGSTADSGADEAFGYGEPDTGAGSVTDL